jgi:stalled ribosome rescue protein Dom34
MKQKDQKQQAGVWLDSQTALIIDNTSDQANNDYTIQHKVKGNASHSGGSEHSMNNSKQADNLKYYKSISGLLLKYDEILLFGPGKAQEQFFNYLKDDAQFKTKQVTIANTEQLTEPQIIATVRDRFN